MTKEQERAAQDWLIKRHDDMLFALWWPMWLALHSDDEGHRYATLLYIECMKRKEAKP